jgi:hypothetical protein
MIMFKPFIGPTFTFVLERCILFVAHSLVSQKNKMALIELGVFPSTSSQHRLSSGEPTTVLKLCRQEHRTLKSFNFTTVSGMVSCWLSMLSIVNIITCFSISWLVCWLMCVCVCVCVCVCGGGSGWDVMWGKE